MGVVYKARQLGLNRLVALKMIKAGAGAGPDELTRFRSEAEAVAHLQHPNIVQVFEVGEHAGLPYFSLEFCPGGGLDKKLAGTPLSSVEAAGLVQTLAAAVDAAHRKGLIHRDLKPANVLLAEDSTPKVADFGLAKKLEGPGLTQTGAVVGTPSYMAPEQARGDPAVGPAADVYALGAILYECLTGRPPFKAANAWDTVQLVLNEDPVPVRRLNPKVPRDLETVCLKCLDKEPAHRFAGAKALAEDLRRFAEGEPVLARPVGRFSRIAKWAWRRPLVAALLIGLLITLVGGASGVLLAYADARREARRADAASLEAIDAANNARGEADRANDEAAKARKAEQHAIDEADAARQERERAERQLYFAKIGQAAGELQNGNVRGARLLLEEVPQHRRHWEYYYLWDQSEGTPLTLRGHTSAVFSVAFSPDGSLLATASQDGTAKLWDARSGSLVRSLGHDGSVKGVTFSPDGSQVATASEDGSAKLWDARSGKALFTLRKQWLPKNAVAFSPEGARLVAATANGSLEAWDTRSGAEDLSFACNTSDAGDVGALAFSPDGARLVTASTFTRVWDVRSGTKLTQILGADGKPAVAWSPDGTRLAMATWEPNATEDRWLARILNPQSGSVLLDLRGHSGQVDGISFSPDGSRIATASTDETAKVWDARTGNLVATLRGHERAVTAVAFSPDGHRLATAASDGTAKIWDAHSGEEPFARSVQEVSSYSIAYSPDGARLVSCSNDGTTKIWDANSGVEIGRLHGHSDAVTSVACSQEGDRLATGSWDHTARIWEARSGATIHTLQGHTDKVTSVAFSRDGSRLATASEDRTARVWDARSGAELHTLRGHGGGVNAVAISPDGARLVTGSFDGTAKVWDMQSGADCLTLRGNSWPVASVVFSPNGERIVTGSANGDAGVWDAHTGRPIHTLRGHTYYVCAAVYSPDGVRLFTASTDGTIKIWDADSGSEVLTLRSYSARAETNWGQAMAISPDGSRLATARCGGPVKIWSARTSGDVRVLRGHTGDISAVAFSADEARLATASADGTAKVWDIRSAAEIRSVRPGGEVTGVAFSADGSLLRTRQKGGQPCSWEISTGKAIPTPGQRLRFPTSAFSPGGLWFADTYRDEVRLHSLRPPPPPWGYAPWTEDARRRRALEFTWHADGAEAGAVAGDRVTVDFHRKWLDASAVASPADRVRRGLCRIRSGDLASGLADLAHADVARDSDFDRLSWHVLGCLATGNQAGYRAGRSRLGEILGPDPHPAMAELAVLLCCATANRDADPDRWVRLAQKATDARLKGYGELTALGLALFRAHRPADAIERFREAGRAPFSQGKHLHEVLMCLAYQSLGDWDAARRSLQSAAASWMDRQRLPASVCGAVGAGPAGAVSGVTALLAERPESVARQDDEALRTGLLVGLLRAEAEEALSAKPTP
jgi:WD40 repeat protein